MDKPKFTPGPYELIAFGTKLDDWTGASFTIRAEKAPGGVALTIGGLGEGEELANAQLFTAATEMYNALKWVKDWFNKLEDATDEDDPLKEMRRKVHAPIHAQLDTAIARAEGR